MHRTPNCVSRAIKDIQYIKRVSAVLLGACPYTAASGLHFRTCRSLCISSVEHAKNRYRCQPFRKTMSYLMQRSHLFCAAIKTWCGKHFTFVA